MVSTEKGFNEIAELYNKLFAKFFELHKIKKVVCTDMKECFFDRIEVDDDGTMNVYKYDFSFPFDWLSLDYTMDYAKCLSNMEHDLFMQERRGKHNSFTFYFTDLYEEPTLIEKEEIDKLENEYEQRRNEVV